MLLWLKWPCHALCLAALVLGAVTHLGNCVWSGHDWRCVVAPWRSAHSFVHSFTRDVLATICLDLLVVCRFPHQGLRRFPFWIRFYFQRCIYRTVMRTIAQRTVHTLLAVIAMLVCIVCMSASSVQRCFSAADATRRQRPYPHACTARPRHCLHVLSPGLEPPGCRSGPRSTFLVECVVIFSLSLRTLHAPPPGLVIASYLPYLYLDWRPAVNLHARMLF